MRSLSLASNSSTDGLSMNVVFVLWTFLHYGACTAEQTKSFSCIHMNREYNVEFRCSLYNNVYMFCFFGNFSTPKTERNTCDLWIRNKSYAHLFPHIKTNIMKILYTHISLRYWLIYIFKWADMQQWLHGIFHRFSSLKCNLLRFIVRMDEYLNSFGCFISIQFIIFLNWIDLKYSQCYGNLFDFLFPNRYYSIFWLNQTKIFMRWSSWMDLQRCWMIELRLDF